MRGITRASHLLYVPAYMVQGYPAFDKLQVAFWQAPCLIHLVGSIVKHEIPLVKPLIIPLGVSCTLTRTPLSRCPRPPPHLPGQKSTPEAGGGAALVCLPAALGDQRRGEMRRGRSGGGEAVPGDSELAGGVVPQDPMPSGASTSGHWLLGETLFWWVKKTRIQ